MVSVGVVGDAAHLLQGRGTPDQIFAEEVADCPSIAERLDGSEKIAGLDVVKEYSYTTERPPATAGCSSATPGASSIRCIRPACDFALKSGQLAADCIVEGFQKNDLSGAQLGKWVPDFDDGTNWVRKLVLANQNTSAPGNRGWMPAFRAPEVIRLLHFSRSMDIPTSYA